MLLFLIFILIFRIAFCLKCFDSNTSTVKECNSNVKNCYVIFDPAFQYLIYRGCYHPLADYYKQSTYVCNQDNCNSLKKMPFKRPLLEDFKCWKNNETVNCAKNVCYTEYANEIAISNVINTGCVEELKIENILNQFQSKRRFEFCAQPLCNQPTPHFCYDGFEGDCEDFIPEYKNVENDFQINDVKLIQCGLHNGTCVKRTYDVLQWQCIRYSCHHYNYEHGVRFNRKPPKKPEVCKTIKTDDIENVKVCQCLGDKCFQPILACRKSKNHELGDLIQCSPNTKHCKTAKNVTTGQIKSRGCGGYSHEGCDRRDGKETCFCSGNNCNGLYCYDSEAGKNILCEFETVNCFAEFDNSYMFVAKRGCGTSEHKETYEDDNRYYCETDGCNSPNSTKDFDGEDLRPNSFRCFRKYNGSGEVTKVHCSNKLCLTVHQNFDLKSPIVSLDCADATETRSGNVKNKNKYEVCAEPLCNSYSPYFCFEGYLGDCNWLEKSRKLKGVTLHETDRHHVKQICIKMRFRRDGKECYFLSSFHKNASIAINLVINNPTRKDKCITYLDKGMEVKVCQCTDNRCNALKIAEIYCYHSNDASLGKLRICPEFTTHCRIIRDIDSKKILQRLCSPIGDVEVSCIKEDGYTVCDCLGSGCNQQTDRGCWVGFYGNCGNETKPVKYEYCQGVPDEYCYTMDRNSGECVEHSCDLIKPSDSEVNWPSTNEKCVLIESDRMCRHPINQQNLTACYVSTNNGTIQKTDCSPYVTHCRIITDLNSKKSRTCSPLLATESCAASFEGVTACDCFGEGCNGAINCYSSSKKKIVPCPTGITTCFAIIDNSYQFAIERDCGDGRDFIGYEKNKFYCNTDDCNDNLFPDTRPDDFKCYINSQMDTKDCPSKMCKIFNNSYGCENEIMTSGDFGKKVTYETCAEPLCNHPKPWKCYQGFIGDCLWLTKNDTGFDIIIETPYVAECDYWHVKDICVQQTWTNKMDSDRVCKYFTCHHTHAEYGVKLIRESKEKKDDCVEAEISGHHVRICQCTNKECNRPVTPSMSCYISSNSELGVLTNCPEYTTHCQEKRIKETGAVLERKCSPVGRVHPQCHERDGYQYCDCAGNGCNNREQFKKKCYVGTYGNCQSGELDPWLASLNHQPVSKDCASWFDNDCHTTRIPNKGQLCTVFSCDYQQIGIHSRAVFGKFRCVNTQWKEKPLKLVSHCRCSGENCQRAQQIIENLRREQQMAAVHKAFNTSG